MDEKELRIGNLIDLDGQEGFEVLSVGAEYVTVEYKNYQTTRKIDEFLPVILTEEWLIKFDLKLGWTESFYFYTFEGSELEAFYKENSLNEIPIKYIHQLQNLYFALTGEELTITP